MSVTIRSQDDWRVCPICKPLDDTVWDADQPRPVPPFHPHCRCWEEYEDTSEPPPEDVAGGDEGATLPPVAGDPPPAPPDDPIDPGPYGGGGDPSLQGLPEPDGYVSIDYDGPGASFVDSEIPYYLPED